MFVQLIIAHLLCRIAEMGEKLRTLADEKKAVEDAYSKVSLESLFIVRQAQ